MKISRKKTGVSKNNMPKGVPTASNKPFLIWVVVLGLILMILHWYGLQEKKLKFFSYSEFKQAVKENNVKTFSLTEGTVSAEGELVQDSEYTGYKVNVLAGDTDLPKLLEEHNVNISVAKSGGFWSNMFYSVFPTLLFVFLLWFLIYRQARGAGKGIFSFGKSRARLFKAGEKKITFEDVAGLTEAKEEVEEIIDFLKDPKKFQKLGGKIPKGVLLVGPPGTGKTLLAKSIAGEANVPFFSISGSDFVEMFVGVGASRVRDLFEQGRKSAPAIIFIDEIDAVGRHRGAGIGGGHDEREQTLNALLVDMDGFDAREGLIIVAATNRPDVLDTALLRPGRFDRQIVLDLPDLKGREEILKVHCKNIKLSKEIDLQVIARGTPMFSGADLANLVNEAALLAARRNKDAVNMEELEESRDKVRWGRERKSRALDDKDKKITAYHESGHALLLELLEDVEPLHKVTIIPRGMAYLGATMQLPEKDKYHEFKKEALAQITGLMGGRIAEELIFGDITSGARNDIKVATQIARAMVCEWGMSRLGPVAFGNREEHLFLGREIERHTDYSEVTAQEIDKEIKNIIDESYERGKKMMVENRDKLELITKLLLEKEVIDGKEVTKIVRGESVSVNDAASPDAQVRQSVNEANKTQITNESGNAK
jgi:cell division protease FtsH